MDNRDSDQSISENEEDIDANWLTNPTARENKDWLKMFTFWNEDSKFRQSSGKEVTNDSDEEAISDADANNVTMGSSCMPKSVKVQRGSLKSYKRENDRYEASTWSAVNKEAEELIVLHDSTSRSSSRTATLEAKKIAKGNKGKAKPKFSIHFLSHKGESSLPSIVRDENETLRKVCQIQEGLEDLEDIVMEHSMTELVQGLEGESDKQSEVQVLANLSTLKHRDAEHSVSELLDGLQAKCESVERTTKLNIRTKSKKYQITTRKRNMYQLGGRILDNEDPSEPVDGDTSSEDEAAKLLIHGQNQMRVATLQSKGQTMSDRFQEAFNDTTGDDDGTRFSSFNHTGYYSRLQQVMQTDKERHAKFLKQLLELSGQGKCIWVKIMSRCLEAKLTVCECSCQEKNENSHCASPNSSINIGSKTTIIFNPRMCSDVEIEVGNIICIHPPWNEVQVMGKDKSIILCTYFSLIST
ncbi:hypothetical protein MKW98_031690 [Papaver atlanticum]|uniref:Uncharacterized protein n=1 Tax=Papaver atlanticum TaxID=357466 RepID=A0AAD4X9U0_9MAGN|nr:hypothetical protein MKW98_031690 [Papaver atlanticum]